MVDKCVYCRLMNLGNTCYMNVIVQILCNLPTFVNAMERFFGSLVMEDLLEVRKNTCSQTDASVSGLT